MREKAKRLTDAQLLDREVVAFGLLYGALEEIRDLLEADNPVKWARLVRGVGKVLQKADEVRREF